MSDNVNHAIRNSYDLAGSHGLTEVAASVFIKTPGVLDGRNDGDYGVVIFYYFYFVILSIFLVYFESQSTIKSLKCIRSLFLC